jgi:transposase
MPNVEDDNLLKWTAEAKTVGIHVDETLKFSSRHWPDTFQYEGITWKKDNALTAANGEVQYVEYTDGNGKWLVVYRD